MKKSLKAVPLAVTLLMASMSASVWAADAPVVVDQTVLNTGDVTNTTPSITGSTKLELGDAASTAASTTGAVASVSVSSVNAVLPNPTGDFGTITQAVSNSGTVSNGATGEGNAAIINLGSGSLGTSASVSSSASGAVASVSVSTTTTTADGLAVTVPAIGDVTQGLSGTAINNSGDVSNYATVTTTGDLGLAASASISATGAVASVSIRGVSLTNDTVAAATFTGATVGDIGQVVQNTGTITNVGVDSGLSVGVLGVGASASISATGAVASVSTSMVNANLSGLTFGTVNQTVSNTTDTTSSVNNSGTLTASSLGDGASASVSASGAVASVSVSGLTDSSATAANFTVPTFGAVTQSALNTMDVKNGVTDTSSVTVTTLGQGASASVSATGAVASLSVTTNNEVATAGTFGNVTQTANNGSDAASPAITNTGSIAVGATTGAGSSMSVSASGSVASFSVSSIVDNTIPAATTVGSITQTSNNYGTVTNTGSISFSTASLGAGSSASVSATGAVSSVSFRTLQ